MKKYHIFTIAITATIISQSCSHQSGNISQAQVPTIDVSHPIVDSVMLYRSYPAFLSANLEVDIVARVNGYLIATGYKDGELVNKGQILFRIDDSQYRDAVKRAQAQLETARSTSIYTTNRYESMKEAMKSDAVSQIDVIQAESDMKESQASIKAAEAALQIALTNLSYCTIRAPFTGHISAASADVGTFLDGEASPVTLARLYDDNTMSAHFAIDDNSYMKMFTSQDSHKHIDYSRIPIKFNETLPHSYSGKLDYMSPNIDTSTGTLNLRVRIDNPHGELRSGMFATIELPYSYVPKAILVKDESIGSDQTGHYLYTVNDSGKVSYTPIKTSELYHDTLRIITEGLPPQSLYVTKALLKVRDGMIVKPIITQ